MIMTNWRNILLLAVCIVFLGACSENTIPVCQDDDIAVNYLAAWNGSHWDDMNGGVDGEVWVVATDPKWGYVYVGGEFMYAGGVHTGGVARWDPKSRTWSALGGILDGSVRALLVVDGDLYVGGYFYSVNDSNGGAVPVDGFGKWNGTSWTEITYVQGSVETLALVGNTIWVSGRFSHSSSVNSYGIATLDITSNTWSVVGQADNTVRTISSIGSDVAVGGSFSSINGTRAIGIARYNQQSGTWASIGDLAGSSFHDNSGNLINFAPYLDDMHLFKGSLYIVGSFSKVGEVDGRNIARYDIAANRWTVGGIPDRVKAMISQGDDLYFAGAFDFAGSSGFGGVARYSSSNSRFYPLGGGLCSTSDFKEAGTSFAVAKAIDVLEGVVYVGGHFNRAID